ncbi:septal ring lytic transglycosylase RlpA family protein [Deinococcus marmoris]|uniref:septal ring lytic transglycosylase RlpA family protein n=1 Tax=Deinococcus marmoris TaxID=249408 RepID=UPI0024812E08|nr:septal ring lytic transglycosylase RlpA family protein [Deinococcus marmoris]
MALALTLILSPLGGVDLETASASSAVFQSGSAVYYGGRAARGTVMTAAHRSLPFGTWVRVTHSGTGRSVDVMINDRGPFGNSRRIIDLSRAAAASLGILSQGVAPVSLRILSRP